MHTVYSRFHLSLRYDGQTGVVFTQEWGREKQIVLETQWAPHEPGFLSQGPEASNIQSVLL